MAATIVYGKGDTCLKLNPYDNYRMFTMYEDWTSDDRVPLDLSSSQTLYITFKSKNKEIRIAEYTPTSESFTVDKTNGQVLFKISQKDAIDILSLDNHVFYITRLYELTDSTGENVMSSDEEVLYTGLWADESTSTTESYTSQIKTLTSLLADRNTQIANLQTANAELISQNVDLASQVEDLQSANDTLTSQVSELETQLSSYTDGDTYDGEVIGEGTYTNIVSTRAYTEDELKNALKSLETTTVD